MGPCGSYWPWPLAAMVGPENKFHDCRNFHHSRRPEALPRDGATRNKTVTSTIETVTHNSDMANVSNKYIVS